MQRGKKQGLWVGRRVPEVDDKGAPILYRRYTRVEEVLLENVQKQQQQQARVAKRAAATDSDSDSDSESESEGDSSGSGSGSGSDSEAAVAPPVQKAKRAKKGEPQQSLDAGTEGGKLSKKEKKLLRKQQQQQQQQQQQEQGADGDGEEPSEQQDQAAQKQSGAGNAAQAKQIRGVLGYENGAAAPGGGFAFSFDAEVAAQVEAETEAKLARLHAIDSADRDGYVPRRVFVGGMPYSYTREQVEEYWGWCGEIESLDMLTFPDSGRFRGIAFITFRTQEGYDAALACDGEALDGQTLKVDKCKAAAASKRGGGGPPAAAPKPSAAAPPASGAPAAGAGNRGGAAGGSGRPAKAPGYNVAYVGNVPFEVTREELAEAFADCGVKLVRLHTDQATGRSKGYAHVHFEDEAGLDRAMKLDGHVLRGRGIRVSYGQPKRGG